MTNQDNVRSKSNTVISILLKAILICVIFIFSIGFVGLIVFEDEIQQVQNTANSDSLNRIKTTTLKKSESAFIGPDIESFGFDTDETPFQKALRNAKLGNDYINHQYGANWIVAHEVSKVDDSDNVMLSRKGLNSYKNAFGKTVTPELMIRCRENKTDVIIDWGMYLGLDRTRVTTRIDSKQARKQNWSISTNNESTFMPSPISTIKTMATGSILYATVTPYGENPVQAEFVLSGLKEKLEPLTMACGWNL